jgi:hypothetical protein
MLWRSIAKDYKGNSQYNQLGHLAEVKQRFFEATQVEVECVVNAAFQSAMREMRVYPAGKPRNCSAR